MFLQAEDGIRDIGVTGVQTCALPISVADESLARSYPEALRGDAARFRRFRARWLANDPGSYAATTRMLAGLEMASEIAALRLPCLFLAGTLDPLRPPAAVEPIARLVPD